MSKRLHDTKLHQDFEKKNRSREDKREKQTLKNDLKRLSHSDVDLEDDATYDDLGNE